MVLTHNVITHGRYYKAGEDIPNDLISDAMRKYAVSDIQQQRRDADNSESKPATRKPRNRAGSYVERNGEFVSGSTVELVSGEKLYWLRKRQFGVDEKFIAFGRVPNEA